MKLQADSHPHRSNHTAVWAAIYLQIVVIFFMLCGLVALALYMTNDIQSIMTTLQ